MAGHAIQERQLGEPGQERNLRADLRGLQGRAIQQEPKAHWIPSSSNEPETAALDPHPSGTQPAKR